MKTFCIIGWLLISALGLWAKDKDKGKPKEAPVPITVDLSDRIKFLEAVVAAQAAEMQAMSAYWQNKVNPQAAVLASLQQILEDKYKCKITGLGTCTLPEPVPPTATTPANSTPSTK